MRESNRPRIPGFRPQQTSHIIIPAFYKAGVTFFVKKDSSVYRELLEVSDIPLKKDVLKSSTTNLEVKQTSNLPPVQVDKQSNSITSISSTTTVQHS